MIILKTILCAAIAQTPLKLKKIISIQSNEPFELSGICLHPKAGVLIVADNNKNIFALDTTEGNQIKIYRNVKLPKIINEKFDLEAIDVYKRKIYIADERTSKVYRVKKNGTLKEFIIDFETYNQNSKEQLNVASWENTGFEGMAFGAKNKVMYLAKERQTPKQNDNRFIISVNTKKGEITEKFNIDDDKKGSDFTDLKFEKKGKTHFVYALNRNEYVVSRIDLQTKSYVKYSFKEYMTDENGNMNLYESENAAFGIAEALLLTPNEIWIGLDNNNQPINLNNELAKKYKIKGTNPIILIFERPSDF